MRCLALALLILTGLTRPAAAQQFPDNNLKAYAFFSADPNLPATPPSEAARLESLALRPNAEQAVYVYVVNPTKNPLQVTVRLNAGAATLGTAQVAIPESSTARVALAPPANRTPTAPAPVPTPDAKTPDAKTPDAKAPPAPPRGSKLFAAATDNIRTGAYQLALITERQNTGVLEWSTRYEARIQRPGEYFADPDAVIEQDGSLKVTLQFKPNAQILGRGPAALTLDLRPDLNPNLVKTSIGEGTFAANVPFGQTGTLFAEGLQVTDGKISAFISVDGVPRAFRIDTSLVKGAQPTLDTSRFLGVRLSTNSQPPGEPIAVTVEADNLADDKLPLRLLVDRVGAAQTSNFDVLREFPTSEDEQAYLAVAQNDDAVLFTTILKDWSLDYPTVGQSGRRLFTLSVGEAVGAGLTRPTEVQKQGVLILDRTPPEVTAFLDLPARDKILISTPLTLKARATDEESGIQRVLFFTGELAPDADGKPAPGSRVIPGIWNAKDKIYVSERPLLLPDTKGELTIGVVATNTVGLSTTADAVLLVREPVVPKEKKKPTTGSIAGRVVQAGRPQPGLPVTLLNSEEKPIKSATTAADGTFAFKDLPPGEYLVASVKKADANARGTEPVTVEAADEPSRVTITVKR